ncbi:MAG: hypothetical protein Q9162_004639 [Coniocarpon cinnabarinum]
MGKLIKNHLARLVCLTAAIYQAWAALHGFFWPKVFFDWATVNLNPIVKPIPVLQIVNMVCGFFILALEYPLPLLAGTGLHKSIEARLALYPAVALLAALLYQATDAAGFYIIGIAIWFWAYTEGEVVCRTPWTLPRKGRKLEGNV